MAGSKAKLNAIAIAERRRRAIEMRSGGAKLDAIAAELGYRTGSAVSQDISRALEASRKALTVSAEDHRALELEHLDDVRRRVMAILDATHIVVQQGRIVRDENGATLTDHGAVLAAVDRAMRVADRRAKLLGIDAPAKAELEVEAGVTMRCELVGVSLDDI